MKIFRQPRSGRNGRSYNVISVVEFYLASCISLKMNGIMTAGTDSYLNFKKIGCIKCVQSVLDV